MTYGDSIVKRRRLEARAGGGAGGRGGGCQNQTLDAHPAVGQVQGSADRDPALRKHIPGAAPATHAAELPEPTQRRELASSLLAGDLALVRELPGGHRPAPGHDRAPPAGESPREVGPLLVHLAE